jgi:hypothetical protein
VDLARDGVETRIGTSEEERPEPQRAQRRDQEEEEKKRTTTDSTDSGITQMEEESGRRREEEARARGTRSGRCADALSGFALLSAALLNPRNPVICVIGGSPSLLLVLLRALGGEVFSGPISNFEIRI